MSEIRELTQVVVYSVYILYLVYVVEKSFLCVPNKHSINLYVQTGTSE
jgi:hypothetical protein